MSSTPAPRWQPKDLATAPVLPSRVYRACVLAVAAAISWGISRSGCAIPTPVLAVILAAVAGVSAFWSP